MVSPGLGSIPRTNSAANRPDNRPRPHDRSGCRPRCPWHPGPAAAGQPSVPPPHAWNAVDTVEAGLPLPSGSTEKRAGAAPDEHHLAVEGQTQSQRPERADFPLFIGRAPKPDQTIDLRARPHLTIGSRNRSVRPEARPTPMREPRAGGAHCGTSPELGASAVPSAYRNLCGVPAGSGTSRRPPPRSGPR
jgi:hypothetical protein